MGEILHHFIICPVPLDVRSFGDPAWCECLYQHCDSTVVLFEGGYVFSPVRHVTATLKHVSGFSGFKGLGLREFGV